MVLSRMTIGAVCTFLILGLQACSHNYRLAQDDLERHSSWPFHRGDLAATGVAVSGDFADKPFAGKLDVIWERRESGKPAGPLALSHGILVYPSAKRRIKFFETLTGRNLGKIRCKGIPQTGMVIQDSLAFFSLSPRKNQLNCINLRNGKTIWRDRVKDAASGSIIVNNRLLVGSRTGLLIAYDLNTGEEEWTFQTEGRLIAPAAGDQGVVYQGDDQGVLYALTPDSGNLRFQVTLDGPLVSAPVLSDLLIVTDVIGGVYALDSETGQKVWTTNLDGSIWAAPAVSEAKVFIGLTSGYLVALNLQTGTELWRYRTEEVVRAAPVVIGKNVLVGTLGGKLFCLDVIDGKLLDQRQLIGAIRQCPVSDGDRVYVATESGMIVCCGEINETLEQALH
ncbi:MAG: PQQ-binding-like beta-propeller repeat protein [candidate division Zixibacteria bacterium]|nr:PQQ-binding-like beta-propeller repeat protein [candidate division Zixibacteria bacterium]